MTFFKKDKFEIKREILDLCKESNIDVTTGGFADVIAGSVATQLSGLFNAVDTLTLSLDLNTADADTLMTIGRSYGVYPLAPLKATYRCHFPTGAGDMRRFNGTTVTVDDVRFVVDQIQRTTTEGFRLVAVEEGEHGNLLATNELYIMPGSNDITYKVSSVIIFGRGKEPLLAYKRRLEAYERARPYTGNPAWFSEKLREYGLVGLCRVTGNDRTITVYITDHSNNTASAGLVADLKQFLAKSMPIDNILEVKPAVLTTRAWIIRLTRNTQSTLFPQELEGLCVSALKKFVAEQNDMQPLVGAARISLTTAAATILHDLFPHATACSVTIQGIESIQYYDLTESEIASVIDVEVHT